MGMKFLNKKGWHTGSLRNIENVWKAEQKQEAEQRKLEELRKQIAEERDRDEYRQLQIDAGLIPRQERLEFLYDSGLSVGKTSNEGFTELKSLPTTAPVDNSASASVASASKESAAPGALFEEKPQSANDAWRKLHSDPLLMIRQREQEALARIKNNPVKMAMIRKSVETKKKDDEAHDGEQKKVKSKHKKRSSSKHHYDSENNSDEEKIRKRRTKHKKRELLDSDEDSRDGTRHHKHSNKDYETEKKRWPSSPVKQRAGRNEHHRQPDLDEDLRDRTRHHRHSRRDYESEKQRHSSPVKQKAVRNEDRERLDSDEDSRDRTRPHRRSRRDYESEKLRHSSPSKQKADRNEDRERSQRGYEKSKREEYPSYNRNNDRSVHRTAVNDNQHQLSDSKRAGEPPKQDLYKRRGRAPQLSEEERAARLREMQMDAELHEEERWKRLKKADEDDAREASQAANSRGTSFLDAAQKSVYGAEKGGSSTIEESVRRRSHFLQGRTEVDERNAFRR